MAGQKRVYYRCKKMLQQEDALDTAQETLISRLSGPKSLRKPVFGGWLSRIAANYCGNVLPYESPAHPESPAVEVVEPVSQPDVFVAPGPEPEPVNTRAMKKEISVWLTKFAMWPGDYR